MRMKVFAVIPAFQEENRIAQTVQSVLPFVDGIFVVDDGSADQTAVVARCDSRVRVLRLAINRGQGSALRTGTRAALSSGADVVLHLDADGQHVPESIPDLLQPIQMGTADVVFGSRFLGVEAEGMPKMRRRLLQCARLFNRLVLGIPSTVTDPQSGFRAFRSSVAQALQFEQDRMAHCSEILRRATRSGIAWTEVPVRVQYTAETIQKGQRARDAVKIVWQLFVGLFS